MFKLQAGDLVAYRRSGFGSWVRCRFIRYHDVPKGRKSQVSIICIEGDGEEQSIPTKVLMPVNLRTSSKIDFDFK